MYCHEIVSTQHLVRCSGVERHQQVAAGIHKLHQGGHVHGAAEFCLVTVGVR